MADGGELEEEAWDTDLKHKERLFVLHYCTVAETFLNGPESYKAVYTKVTKDGKKEIPSDATCTTNSSRMLNKERVKLAVRKLLKLTQTELDERNTYKILNNIAQLAFYNPAEIITASGKIKVRKLEDLGDKAKAIAQIRPSMYGPQVTLIDRAKYMELMLKYLNIIRPEQQIEISLPVMEVVPKTQNIDEWNAEAEGVNK